ncbi:creatininase family protein [Variovorax sp. J22R133]|uniref:creatininase family protein n=1 Tax=Variovorax brevis TaxID=3053503 RepID=UPI002575DDB9|nr:creatininase family protein [Variovorax sp. J22R133]MDM0116606.1 creatininase family protein [Variovorax sp. J22R133]
MLIPPRLLMILAITCSTASWSAPTSVYLEELTSTEVRDAVRAGTTTIIIPVGGTEQSGPNMALGKHNVRVKVLAGRIAASLGHTLVAPVVAYVPEGSIVPPAGHMRFAGTISVPEDAFKGVLEGAARSFKQNGFVDVVLIGDHGGYQAQLKAVATRLNHDWAATPARAHFIGDYYRVTQTDYVQALKAKGLNDAQIGVHAGAADTSLMMAIDTALVRPGQMTLDPREGEANGVTGDPRASSAALGQLGVELIVTKTATAIRAARSAAR